MVFTTFGRSTSTKDLTRRWGFINSFLLFIFGFTMTNAALTQCDPPRTEIVSIFNNQYNIPAGFGPFFIKINRCVQCDTCGTEFLIPNVTTLVKAVVQNSITGKVFEYTLHDHISCMCGPITNQKTKYYESTVKEVSASYKKNEKNNPPHILDCNQPQQRYKKAGDYYFPRFYGYKQCLPICTTGRTATSQLTITHWSGRVKKIPLTNAITCSYPQFVSNENNRSIINSKKTFMALVLLALVFLITIIIDLTFCCRKKGFCYSVTRKCMQRNEEAPQMVAQPPRV